MATFLSRGARAALGGALLAVAAVSMPASAAGEPAPTLVATSLTNGWSHLNYVVAAAYDVALVRSLSSATLKDRNGNLVDGVVTLDAGDKRVLVFTPDSPMTETKTPYTITFSARAVDQDPSIPNTVDAATFKLDALAPRVPTIARPTDMISVVGPSDVLTIEGSATDLGQSGIAKVELHFYNPAATAPRIDEAPAYRRTMLVDCGIGVCPRTANYSFSVTGIPTGYWNIRVASVDLAGNRSAETEPVRALIVTSP
jgi:hypothetical protein